MMQLARLQELNAISGLPHNQTAHMSLNHLPYNQLVSPSGVHPAWYSLPQMSPGFGHSIPPQFQTPTKVNHPSPERLVQSAPKRLQTSSAGDLHRVKRSVPGGTSRSWRSLESLYMSRVHRSPSTNTDPGVVSPPVTSSTMHPLVDAPRHPSFPYVAGVHQLDPDSEIDV